MRVRRHARACDASLISVSSRARSCALRSASTPPPPWVRSIGSARAAAARCRPWRPRRAARGPRAARRGHARTPPPAWAAWAAELVGGELVGGRGELGGSARGVTDQCVSSSTVTSASRSACRAETADARRSRLRYATRKSRSSWNTRPSTQRACRPRAARSRRAGRPSPSRGTLDEAAPVQHDLPGTFTLSALHVSISTMNAVAMATRSRGVTPARLPAPLCSARNLPNLLDCRRVAPSRAPPVSMQSEHDLAEWAAETAAALDEDDSNDDDNAAKKRSSARTASPSAPHGSSDARRRGAEWPVEPDAEGVERTVVSAPTMGYERAWRSRATCSSRTASGRPRRVDGPALPRGGERSCTCAPSASGSPARGGGGNDGASDDDDDDGDDLDAWPAWSTGRGSRCRARRRRGPTSSRAISRAH